MGVGLVQRDGQWVPYEEHPESFGEHPELDPFMDDTPLVCGLETPGDAVFRWQSVLHAFLRAKTPRARMLLPVLKC